MFSLKLIAQSLMRERGLFGLWILSLCIAVTGLLVVDVFRTSLTHTLSSKGQKILTADFAISARRALTPEEIKSVAQYLPTETQYTTAAEMLAMVVSHESSRLGSIRFIDDSYPLAGELLIESEGKTKPAQASALKKEPTAWVAPDLLTLMRIKEGALVQIGKVQFRIAGVIAQDSSQTFRFGTMAPRIYIHRQYLPLTGLIQFGSTFSETLLALSPQHEANAKAKIEALFSDPAIEVQTPTDLEQGSLRVLSRLMDYLGLTGLVTLCLGWIAVYYLGRRWLTLESRGAGTLKCLGFSIRELENFLMLKLTLIMFIGVLSGGALAWLAAHALLPLIQASLPAEFTLIWSWSNTLMLVGVGPIAGLLLLLPAIRGMAHERPLILLDGHRAYRTSLWDFLAFSLTTALLFFFLTLVQARSWLVTFIFLGALLGAVVLIAGLSLGLLYLVRRWPQPELSLRRHLTTALWARRRPMAVLMITVSAMSGLLSQLVPNVERTLVSELQTPPNSERPALFLFDIQDEQSADLRRFLVQKNIDVSQQAPFIRARIRKINGAEFERAKVGSWSTREEETDARFRNRGVNLSYRTNLANGESIAQGKPWNQMSHDLNSAEISVEEGYAERLKLKIGDQLSFDIQGLELTAKIASLRKVEWDSFEPNFFIMFPDDVLNEAPKSWILTVKPHPTLKPADIQLLVAEQFPGITAINVGETLQNISELFGRLSAGLKVASALCLLLGLFVFLMILLFQLASSQRDWLQLRVLGLDRRELFGLQLLTYGCLSAVGLCLGSAISLLVAALLAHFAFKTPLIIDWLMMGQVFLVSLLLALGGLIALAWSNNRRASLIQLVGD